MRCIKLRIYLSLGLCALIVSATAVWAIGVTTPAANPSFVGPVLTLTTLTNCSSSGGTCAAAPAGSVSIAAAATTVTVSTTAVTANSQILIHEDSSLGTKLGVTCNTTIVRTYAVTARTAGASFVVTTSAAPVTNPACLSYMIIN
jgi:hypothetical protein